MKQGWLKLRRMRIAWFIISFFGLATFAYAQSRAGLKLTAIDSVDAEGPGGITAAGVNVRFSRSDGVVTIRIKAPTTRLTIETPRGATVYISEPDARFMIVHDCYASNEDHLLIYDAASRGRKPLELAHGDADDYVHVHYEVKGISTEGVTIREDQWAGTPPPRERTLLIKRTRDGFEAEAGKWSPTPLESPATRP
jgi:hypothetical protein